MGNTIVQLAISDKTQNDDVGLFAFTGQGSQLSHFRLAQARVTGAANTHVGALVGQTYGTLSGNSVSGRVATGDYGYAGGLVGDFEGGYSSYNSSSAVVSGGHSSRAGGLVGYGGGYGILYSSATGNISIIDGQAGGLVGWNGSQDKHCHATGNVTASGGPSIAGGLEGIGYEIEDSYALGDVTVNDASLAGGLVGANASVNRSFATGTVRAIGKDGIAGGLVGQTAEVMANSYAMGSVDTGASGKEAGGLVGYYQSFAQVNWSYATGLVGDGQYRGGLAGVADNGDAMTAAYWDLDTSGISDPSQAVGNTQNYPGATGLHSSELKSGLPNGFDPQVWGQSPNINNGYPYLLANPPPK